MPSREQCIREAAAVISEGYAVLYEWPVDAAAERVRRRGESFKSARDRIAARRALRVEQLASCSSAIRQDGRP